MLRLVVSGLALTPMVFVRLLPVLAIAMFIVLLAFSATENVLLRWMAAIVGMLPGVALLLLLALRAGLIQLRLTQPTAPGKIGGSLLRLGIVQGGSVLILQTAIFAPMLFLIARITGGPVITDFWQTLLLMRDYMLTGQAGQIDPVFELVLMSYALPFAVTAALMAVPMAGTAFVTVRKPRQLDPFWGTGSAFRALLPVFFGVSVLLFGAILLMLQIGVSSWLGAVTGSPIVGGFGPVLIVMSIWLAVFGAFGAVGFDRLQQLEAAAREAEISEMVQRRGPQVDPRTLRMSRSRGESRPEGE